MTEEHRIPTHDSGAEKRRVLRARHLISDLAGRMGEADQARQVEANLNDAWLRLQLAQVMNDPGLARRQQRAYESLVDEALEKATPEHDSESG
ncbi:MAG TPA: hypothetical protein VM899_01145 [Rubellimicrobium sp.]|jgi:hypothetical protein|nr:hypothetical protein [Rubellimicrobium sp.]